MSVPFSFIIAPSILTRASDAVESATTDSLQKAECVVPNASQYHVKTTTIPYLSEGAGPPSTLGGGIRFEGWGVI
jgi:hypothetical protein